MKRVFVLLMVVGLIGCSYSQQRVEYVLDNPGVLEDSLYADYDAKTAGLESKYLNKEISYADYLEQKKGLEDQYTQEADRRGKIVGGN